MINSGKCDLIVIGIDQSYEECGVAIARNKTLKYIGSIELKALKNNTEKRIRIRTRLYELCEFVGKQNCEVIIVIERIRLISAGHQNINYIKSIGALNASVVDIASYFGFKVYSVDTRAWKAQVVGSTKSKENKYKIDPKKWLTIQYVINLGYEKKILTKLGKRAKTKIVKQIGEDKYTYNDNIADAICICLYGFLPNKKLQEEH